MSHEWNCRCARCEAEKDWQAECDDDEPRRSPWDDDVDEGPIGLAAFYSMRHAD